MKKIQSLKMMLLGLLAMGSTNAFAGVGLGAEFAEGGLVYKTSNVDASKLTADGELWSVSENAAGKALLAAKTISIPATLTVNVDGENWTITVKKVDANWITNNALAKADAIETLTVDGANLADNDLDNFSYPTSLKNLTLKDKANGKGFTDLSKLSGLTKLETLDIEKCSGITTIPASAFAGFPLKSIKVVADNLTSIGNSAFYSCKDLASFTFGKKLVTIGTYAFAGTALTEADLSKTQITAVYDAAFKESKVATAKLPKTVTAICDYAFYKAPLATLTLEDPKSITAIKSGALAYTKLTEFTQYSGDVYNSAFEGCNLMKTFNFIDPQGGNNIDPNAFIGCIPFVTIYTPQAFIDKYPSMNGGKTVPTNCVWEAKEAPIVPDGTIAFNASGFAKWFHNNKGIVVDGSKYKAFTVYVDNTGSKSTAGTAYFIGMKNIDGNFYIRPYTHVIFQKLKEDTESKGVEYQYATTGDSRFADDIFSFAKDYTLAEFQTGASTSFDLWGGNVTFDNTKYLYRLTANNGVGFRLFTGSTLKGGYDDGTDDKCADAQFFIQSVRKPDASGRLNVVWLDENGNVIGGNATAIEEIETSNEDGAAYNLAGQKVNANYKGVIIKNGKKYMK